MLELKSMNYKLYQMSPSIFVVEMDNAEDLAHTFLRVQEFYESENDDFREGVFTIEEYKKWYCTQSYDGTFSYAKDWVGFNIHSSVIERCYACSREFTKDDIFFLSICASIKNQIGDNGYYLCGIKTCDKETLDHELAHALFSTNLEYRQVMIDAVLAIDRLNLDVIFTTLQDEGYSFSVVIDETQAHLSTGLVNIPETEYLLGLRKQFSSIFNKFIKELGDPILIMRGA